MFTELAFLIFLEVLYRDMALLCPDTPECRAFFVKDQQWALGTHVGFVRLTAAPDLHRFFTDSLFS